MTKNNNIPAGYKASPFGPIPNDWELMELKNVCIKIQDGNYGGDYPTVDEFVEKGIPFLTSKAIGGEGEINIKKIDYITPEKHAILKKAQLKLNDVLFTNRGANVGTIGLVDERIAHGNIGPQLTLLRSNESIINYLFLRETMKSFLVQNQVRTQDSGSAMNFFGIGDTSKFKLLIPPLPEQTALANLLSTWDKAIQTTAQLIEQKQKRKKWLMQMLLTGKKRLKGFEKEKWEKINIGELIKESRIPSINNDPDKRITVKLNLKGIEKREVRGTESEDATAYFIRKKGQFIYGKQNLHKGAFGIIPEELDNFESSQDIPTFDFTNLIYPKYFLYFMSQEGFYASLEKISTGTGSKRIHPEELYKVVIKIPSNKEQIEIANLLDKSAKEIDLMVQKLGSLKEQKKGLMQILLTGKKRLKI